MHLAELSLHLYSSNLLDIAIGELILFEAENNEIITLQQENNNLHSK